MIYAIFGIPLFLSVLNDLGKVLTRVMKYPFFLFKKHARRLFQYCSRMSRDQIKEAEARDKARLEVTLSFVFFLNFFFVRSTVVSFPYIKRKARKNVIKRGTKKTMLFNL